MMINKKIWIYILCFLTFIILLFNGTCCFATNNTNTDITVGAPTAILMEANTGKILYEKNAYEKMYPASTTKIMTAILALENRELSDTAHVSYDAIFTVPKGYSNANLQIDEALTYEQLLNILLIPSANDAANVIAEDIGGSVDSFASMMNTKASEIGCKDTHFVNPNGVHDDNHFSTAYDLALMGRYAMKNTIFRKIVNTVRYTLPDTNKYDKSDRSFINTNNLINNKNRQYYKYCNGIKTGYTDPAKNCIVASAKKDNLELICVILGANNEVDDNKFKDCVTLFDYGFSNYSYKTISKKNDVYKVVSPRNASGDNKDLNILFEDDVNVLVKKSDYDTSFMPEVSLDNIRAPINKGDVIGKISYSVYGINYTTNLIAGQDIEASSVFIIVGKIVAIIILLIIIKCIWKMLTGGKHTKRRAKKGKKKDNYYDTSFYRF